MRFVGGDVRETTRFSEKRPSSFVSTLRSMAVAESAKNQLLRNFRSGSIFDFCNTIGTFRTLPNSMTMSGHQGKADLNNAGVDIRKYP